jgi:hypothetical protein
MARKRTADAAEGTDFNPAEFDPAMQPQAAAVVQDIADSTQMPGGDQVNSQAKAEGGPRKKWTPPADPFGFENMKGDGNRVRLLKSEDKTAWVIRFDKNPNEMEGYSKDNPHPVLKMLKEEGYRWGFDNDSKGGWGKAFSGDAYGADHIEARRVLQKAAEMIGATIDQGQGVSA